MTTTKRPNRAPKYSIAYESKRSGVQGRKQCPSYSNYTEAKKAAAQLNEARRIPSVGRYIVIEL